ncbi:hypothetical protein EON63_17640 [archaeon]|nr:MAG: hypothetical protein EON63_17640 [archaeon]
MHHCSAQYKVSMIAGLLTIKKPAMLSLLSNSRATGSRFVYQSSLLLSRNLAVTGRHSKIVAGKKNRLDAQKNKLFTRLGVKLLMVI